MSKTKFALLAAVVTIGISSPVLAQSRHHGLNDYGLVNWQNVYDVVRKVRCGPAQSSGVHWRWQHRLQRQPAEGY
jgi:hypothetical protein